jgi:hypothetical protein
VLGEERLAGLEVEGDRGRLASGDVRNRERSCEPLCERGASGARRRSEDEREEGDDRQTTAGHLVNSSEHEHARQA